MDEDKIILDQKSFEALAVNSRVKLLKSLKQRRKTLSELAEEQKMSVSGVKEHLDRLERVGLIQKMDDGHKWKYYQLTKKGSEIIGPREIRVWILLVTAVLALVASMTAMISVNTEQMTSVQPLTKTTYQSESNPVGSLEYNPELLVIRDEPGESAPPRNKSEEMETTKFQTPNLTIPMIVAGVSALTLLGCVLILVKNRRKYPIHE